VSRLLFAPAGTDLAYFGERQGRMYGVFNGQEEVLPEGVTPKTPVINQAGKSVGVLMSANNTVSLYQMFRDSGRKGNVYDEANGLSTAVMALCRHLRHEGEKLECGGNGKEGPKFDRVVTPRFSPDGKFLVYRAARRGSVLWWSRTLQCCTAETPVLRAGV